jgi:hypothetical protein
MEAVAMEPQTVATVIGAGIFVTRLGQSEVPALPFRGLRMVATLFHLDDVEKTHMMTGYAVYNAELPKRVVPSTSKPTAFPYPAAGV